MEERSFHLAKRIGSRPQANQDQPSQFEMYLRERDWDAQHTISTCSNAQTGTRGFKGFNWSVQLMIDSLFIVQLQVTALGYEWATSAREHKKAAKAGMMLFASTTGNRKPKEPKTPSGRPRSCTSCSKPLVGCLVDQPHGKATRLQELPLVTTDSPYAETSLAGTMMRRGNEEGLFAKGYLHESGPCVRAAPPA